MSDIFARIIPSEETIKKFVDEYNLVTRSNLTENELNEVKEDICNKVKNPYGAKLRSIHFQKIYAAFEKSYKRVIALKLFNEVSKLKSDLKNQIASCNKNKVMSVQAPLGGVADLLNDIATYNRAYVDKRKAIKSYVTMQYKNSLNPEKAKDASKIDKVTNVIYNYITDNTKSKTFSGPEKEVYNKIEKDLKKLFLDGNYSYNEILNESEYVAKTLNNLRYVPQPKVNLELGLKLNLSQLNQTNEQLISSSKKELENIKKFVALKYDYENVKKNALKIEYIEDEINTFNSKKLFIGRKNVNSSSSEYVNNVNEAVNILFAYNLKACNAKKEDLKKEMINFAKTGIEISSNVDKKDFLQGVKTFEDFRQFNYVNALINTLNMSKLFLGEDALKVVETQLTEQICDGLLFLNGTPEERFNTYLERVSNLILEVTEDNFDLLKEDIMENIKECLIQPVNFEKHSKNLKTLDKMLEVCQLKYNNTRSIQLKDLLANNITREEVELTNSEKMLSTVMSMYLVNKTARESMDFHKMVLNMTSQKNQDFLNFGKPNKKSTKSEIREYYLSKFQEHYESKGYVFRNEVKSLKDLTTSKQVRKEHIYGVKYYKKGFVSGKVQDLVEDNYFNNNANKQVEERLNNFIVEKDGLMRTVGYFAKTENILNENENLTNGKDLFDMVDYVDKKYPISFNSIKYNKVLNVLTNDINEVKAITETIVTANHKEVKEFTRINNELNYLQTISEEISEEKAPVKLIELKDIIKEENKEEVVNNANSVIYLPESLNKEVKPEEKLEKNKEVVNKVIDDDIDTSRIDEYMKKCKISVGARLNSAVANSLGASKKSFERRTNPNLIYKEFDNVVNEDRKEYNNVIANLCTCWTVHEENKGLVKDDGYYFATINQISNFLNNINELVIYAIAKLPNGIDVLSRSAHKGNYTKLNEAMNVAFNNFVKETYNKEFSNPADGTKYFMDKMIIDVSAKYIEASKQTDVKKKKVIINSVKDVLETLKNSLVSYNKAEKEQTNEEALSK